MSAWLMPTSTPMDSLNIQALAGSFTRATTRLTLYSILARVETTRLTSSEPVAATTTSAWRMPARSRVSGSAPLPRMTSRSPNWPRRRGMSPLRDSMMRIR